MDIADQDCTLATHTVCRALARYITSQKWDADFPSPYLITAERLARKAPNDDVVRLVLGEMKGEPIPPSVTT